MNRDVNDWIRQRTNNDATPALAALVEALWDAGYAWFETERSRWEFGRSQSDDVWDEVVVWLSTSRSGLIGFKSAHHATRTITARARSLDATHALITPRVTR